MHTVGIICEYNPFHLGHRKQLDAVRDKFPGCTIVCLMSGSYVQRGEPAIFDKAVRAEAALENGADLVLELPVTYALSSAEGFAAGGVSILSGFCDTLCFGAESGTRESLLATAQALLGSEFREALPRFLALGLSFPAARERALAEIGADTSLLQKSNDILAVEYCKAILCQNSRLEIFPIPRGGDYASTAPDAENPSATFVRAAIRAGAQWEAYVPENLRALYARAEIHDFPAGERAVLGQLRRMREEDYRLLSGCGEGLWRKWYAAAHSCAGTEEILAAVKSKRYTRTRLQRTMLCAYLGIGEQQLHSPAPWCRCLGFTAAGREALKAARLRGSFPNEGEKMEGDYALLEQRCDDLYSLFVRSAPGAPGQTAKRRVNVKP